MIDTIDHLTARRPEFGEPTMSAVTGLDVPPELLTITEDMPERQFSRVVALIAPLYGEAPLNPDNFRRDEEVLRYKPTVGWVTRANSPEDLSADYWNRCEDLAAYVGARLAPLFTDSEFHADPNNPSVAVMMEHTQKIPGGKRADGQPVVVENGTAPFISCTTIVENNLPPDAFGAHIDLVHGAPVIIGFIATRNGTIALEGEYPFVDPMSDREVLTATGDSLTPWQSPDMQLFWGDARTLVHTAPKSNPTDTEARQHIRFFVAPGNPNIELEQ